MRPTWAVVLSMSGVGHAEPRVFVEGGGVVGAPQSSLSNLDTGVGFRVAAGVQGRHAGVWSGYRRIWSGNDTHTPTEIWTAELMIGMRFKLAVAARIALLLDG
ncbi:MAG TPA: hypothetical protein VK427_26560 [Kofleriaceae bacterium]|nr:hypothetical protein [Kofleriaceae bacterium]